MSTARGTSSATMRVATCKDCQREIENLHRGLDDARQRRATQDVKKLERELDKRQQATFTYSEFAANGVLDRGGSRSDRCPEHRRKHRGNIQGMAVAYVDLATVGVALGADEPEGPAGPFGGLGPLPSNHQRDTRFADLSDHEFGMTDKDIVRILEILRHKRVLVLRAGTGTGKSTFGPLRLMDPPSMADLERLGLIENLAEDGIHLPPEGPFRLTDIGPIIVTEPRVAAATCVAQFVGEKLAMGCKLKQCSNAAHGTFNPKAHPDGPDGVRGPSCPDIDHDDPSMRCTRDHVCKHPGVPPDGKLPRGCEVSGCSSHIGPGFPVGYHAAGVRNWDDACQLVYATDGAVINWLRDGRLSRIGTVIVDEAHERSTNIDFIMGYLKRDLSKYPHLRVIITSATFDPEFYGEYFGKDVAEVMNVSAPKSVGYGMPLFPELDATTPEMATFLSDGGEWQEPWALDSQEEYEEERTERFIRVHWPPTLDADGKEHRNDRGEPVALAPALKETEVLDPADIGHREDIHDTTRKLLRLRLPEYRVPKDRWKEQMPDLLAEFVIDLVRGLDDEEIFGDVLAFLPTGRTITATCEKISAALGKRADVCALLSSLKQDEIDRALNARKKGDKRKVVISTNLAETSLTVEGVRFVVDTGLIAQSKWDSRRAAGRVETTDHSRSGIKQRWGRVGRKAPGWVFPLYSKAQFAKLAADTPPGSARENLEALMMTARMGGVDDVQSFPWPAAFLPKKATLDEAGKEARRKFIAERDRADAALRSNGAVNDKGHPTTFGKELVRFSGMGSTASAMAVMYADRLACVPEVLTILGLLEDTRLISQNGLLHDEYAWPDEWRVEASARHRGLASLAEDDAHLVLLITAAWERADPNADPWEPSSARRAWARQWWINDQVLLEMAVKRKEVLTALSPGMKKPVRRPVEPALLDRARGVLGRTLRVYEFRLDGGAYVPAVTSAGSDGEPSEPLRFLVENDSVMKARPERVLALRRREDRGGDSRISSLVVLPSSDAASADSHPASSLADAMELLLAFKERAAPDARRDVALRLIEEWPVGQRRLLSRSTADDASADVERRDPFARPRTDEEAEQDGVARRSRRSTRKQRRRYDDDGEPIDAELADTATELPSKLRGIDEDRIEARARARAGRAIDQRACGTCDECLAGRLDDCTERPEQLKNAKDVLRAWKRSSSDVVTSAMLATKLAFPDGGPSDEPAWFEVVGYDASESPSIVLAPDWRAADADPDPARHPDADPGDPIEVTVGDVIEDHSGPLRTFHRRDGLGRFLLREAHHRASTQSDRGQIAVSLDLAYQGLLEQLQPGAGLTATVVAGRAPDTVTITLLEHLRQHLDSKPYTIQRQVDPHDPKSKHAKYHPAVVESTVNEYGRWSIRLLRQDSSLGLRHFFNLRTSGAAGDDHEPPEDWTPVEAKFEEGRPLAIRLEPIGRSNLALRKLNVGGLDLDKLDEIVRESLRTLRLEAVDDGGQVTEDEEPDDAEDLSEELAAVRRPAPPTARVVLVGDDPLSRASAAALAALDEADAWQRRIWTYWARTHHLLVAREHAFIDSDARDPVEHHAETAVDTTSRLDARRSELANFAESTPLWSTLQGTVRSFRHDHIELELVDGLDAILWFREFDWDPGVEPSTVVSIGDPVRVVLIEDVDLGGTKRPVVSRKRLLPDPLEEYGRHHDVGARVSGTIRQVEEKKAHLDLAPGVVGLLTISDVSHDEIASVRDVLDVGDVIDVAIREVLTAQRMVRVSRKQFLEDPFDRFRARYPEGSTVLGRVTAVLEKKANVELPGGAKAFITIGDVAWQKLTTVREMLNVGDEVQARVVEFEARRRLVRLSMKVLLPKPAEAYRSQHHVGEVISGVVVKNLAVNAAWIDLGGGVDGRIHVRNLTRGYVAKPDDIARAGQVVTVRILEFTERNVELALVSTEGMATPTRPASTAPPVPPRHATPLTERRLAVPPRPSPSPAQRRRRLATGTGRTVEAAVRDACGKLGVSVQEVTYEIVSEPKLGLFRRVVGLAEVRVWTK